MKTFANLAAILGVAICAVPLQVCADAPATAPAAEVAPSAPVPAVADEVSVAAFIADCNAKAIAAEKANRFSVTGREGWQFLTAELHHTGAGKFWGEAAAKVSRAFDPEAADPTPAILDFKEQLDRAGIELLFVPVPPKSVVYADMASSKATAGADSLPRYDKYHQEFYEQLRQKGVNVLDLTPEFLAARYDKGAALYCKTDTHWSGRACVIAARRIAATLKDKAWLTDVPKLKLEKQMRTVSILGDLTMIQESKAPPRETLSLRFIGTHAKLKPVAPDLKSPVILLGDSHDLVFSVGEDMHTKGAGLPDQLAFELGFAVDLAAVRGSGATPSRAMLVQRGKADAKYMAGKKLVVWCFSSREFTESSGWQKVPVIK